MFQLYFPVALAQSASDHFGEQNVPFDSQRPSAKNKQLLVSYQEPSFNSKQPSVRSKQIVVGYQEPFIDN